jgi:hypothetical protein
MASTRYRNQVLFLANGIDGTKFDLISLTPHALGIPHALHRPEPVPILVAPPPTPLSAALPEAHRRHPGSEPNFCSRHTGNGVINQPCCMCQVHQPSGSVTVAVDRCEGDLHRPGLDPHRTTSHMPSREVGALLDTAAEVPSGIILSVDEIDDDWTDTFRPFVSEETQAGATPEDFLSQITFEGDEDLPLSQICRHIKRHHRSSPCSAHTF